MLDCKTYFAANPSSFPSDESRIIFVLSTLKGGLAKQWGQYYLSQTHQGHMDGILVDWDAFETGFLSNWTDPAALLTAECKLGQLQQRGSANDYATEFYILLTHLEWDDSAYMAAFRKGLKSEVRAKLIEHSLSRPICTLDNLITTACLIDDALFTARKECQQHTGTSRISEDGQENDANPLINWRTLVITLPETEQGQIAEPPKAPAVPPEFQEFTQVFGEEFFTTLPPHCTYDCEIPLEEGKDVPYGPIYPMTPVESLVLKEQLDSELAAGKVRPSTSPAGAPVMFVKRADGCLSCKDLYKLDLRNGFNNVHIKEGDEWKTAFRTKYGHFKYTVMSFGLTNTPAVFQRLMNNIFRDLLDIYMIVNLDDILIFSNSEKEHLLHIKEVLHCLEANQLFCNPDKCFFLKDCIGYISLTITPEGISMEQEKIKAIREWPTPTTQATFDAIKAGISGEPTLAHPNENKPYFLKTDASGAAMEAVLSQRGEDGRLHPVAFMSSSFSPAEMNYDTHDKELLAIVRAFEDWRIFLEGTEQPQGHLIVAMLAGISHPGLLQLCYHIQARETVCKPDALSRRADHTDLEPSPQLMLPEEHFSVLAVDLSPDFFEELKEALLDDPSLEAIFEAMASEKLAPSIAQKFKDYKLEDGLLSYQGRIVAPDEVDLKRNCYLISTIPQWLDIRAMQEH
ncbi:Retrotransposable element Tf2 [Ceratobasidium theobromae]|uniref:Retrotransposable element Tf2 n=1 Tax=Ceratobasidium theobromae TaxID=1582974 RepID=A0A5N5QA86_9AGAM|nr:Retrotransposable element Tf2 [Ceratobasidium theobromae]